MIKKEENKKEEADSKKSVKAIKKTDSRAKKIITKATVSVKKVSKAPKAVKKTTKKITETIKTKTIVKKVSKAPKVVKKTTAKTIKKIIVGTAKSVKEPMKVKKIIDKKKPIKVGGEDSKISTPIKKIIEQDELKQEKKEIKRKEFYKGLGKRKRAVANVRLYEDGDKVFIINNKSADIYFNNIEHRKIIYDSLETMTVAKKFKVQVLVRGGGLHAQAEAIRHGISRALLDFDNTFRKKLKIIGFLTRDPRRRERKKPGLKRARKAKQWRKR